jgi:hypothetical protein
MRFRWKVSSERGFDYLHVSDNGLELRRISGEIGWQDEEISLVAGEHRVRWTYHRDGMGRGGMDRGWLDAVGFVPGALLRILQSPEAVEADPGQPAGFFVEATVPWPWTLDYQWLRDGVALNEHQPGLKIPSVAVADYGEYSVRIIDVYGHVDTAPVRLAPRRATVLRAPASTAGAAGRSTQLSVDAAGRPPLRYQWRENGVELAGATNAALHLGPLTLCDGGDYQVLVANDFGSELSTAATLTVGPEPMVVGWGEMAGGQPVPAQLSNGVVSVTLGRDHAVALLADGRVLGWGSNTNGQISFTPSYSNIMAVAAGGDFTLVLRSNRTLLALGDGRQGQTRVPLGLTGVQSIAAGEAHGLALRTNGTITAWGRSVERQTTVPLGLPRALAIGAGANHSLAVLSNTTVRAWGANDAGQTNVPANLTNVVAVSGGLRHSLALLKDGTVIGWGDNLFGQTNTPPSATNVVAIAAGRLHNLVLRADGTVVGWGDPASGAIEVPLALGGVMAIAAGPNRGLAVTLRPRLSSSPCGEGILPGAEGRLAVGLLGPGPWNLRWFREGAALAGETNLVLNLNRFGLDQVGQYSFEARNPYGTVHLAPVFVGLPPSLLYLEVSRQGEEIALRWQAGPTPPVVEASSDLIPGGWAPLNVPVTHEGYLQRSVTPLGPDVRLFRLRRP